MPKHLIDAQFRAFQINFLNTIKWQKQWNNKEFISEANAIIPAG